MISTLRYGTVLVALGAAVLVSCSKTTTTRATDKATDRGTADTSHVVPVDGNAPRALTLTDSQRTRITVTPVSPTKYRPELETTGTVAFNLDNSTPVISPISGPVIRIVRFAGAKVHAGDVLATVSSPDFASAVADYRKAEATFKNAKEIADQDEQLFKNDALARRDLDQARTDLANATADVESAEQQLHSLGVDDSVIAEVREGKRQTPVEGAIRSPLTGTVVEQMVSPGQLLQGGTTQAFTVADLSSVWVMANVFESDLSVVEPGEHVDITTPASAKPVAGRVDYVGAIVDPGTRATAVRIVAENPGEVLKRDMFVQVSIHGAKERTGFLIPVAAVLRDDDNLPFVYIERADHAFIRRQVTLGGRLGDRYEILGGLQTGDRVVMNGGLFLQFAESQ